LSRLPSIIISGGVIYPEPGLVTLMFVILPAPINASAFAPEPPPPTILIIGLLR